MKAVEELLLDLVAIPSVSSMSNRPVIGYVISNLDCNRWRTQIESYTDAKGTAKLNLIATTGDKTSDPVEMALVCHSDTVPFDPGWPEAVHPAIRDGRIYGRGACDVKGFLACALAALDAARPARPLALIVTAEEEIGCLGAKRLAARRAIAANYMIVGEPTGMRAVGAGKGYSLATIVVRGHEAHSAFPSEGRSAIYDAARVALALERVARELENERDPAFDPPFTTLNLGTIAGGTAKNIIPGECRLLLEWRPIPGQPAGRVPGLIERELAALRQSVPGFDAELRLERMDPAFAPSATHDLADLLSSLTQQPSATISFGSEAAHLSPLSRETIVFGPGDMTVAHRTGEHIAIADLHACVAHLNAVIGRLCGLSATDY